MPKTSPQDNMLPYVDEKFDAVPEDSATTSAKGKKTNPWVVVTLILSSLTVALALLIMFSAGLSGNDPTSESNGLVFVTLPAFGLALALSVAGVILATRRKQGQKLAWILLGAIVVLSAGVTTYFVTSVLKQEKDVFVTIPANYQKDLETGMALKMTPETRIDCDENGTCSAKVDFIADNNSSCVRGGELIQTMLSERLGATVSSSVKIPPLKPGETAQAELIWITTADDSLLFHDFPVIFCSP